MKNKENKPKFNQEQYKMLLRCTEKKDISEWNEWREKNTDVEIHLQEARLGNAHLEGANLAGAQLQGAILEKAYLKEARLIGTHLEEANLHEANLEGANIHEAHLEGADIHHAELSNVNLRNIWFDKKTKCEDTLFGDTVLSIYPECNISENEVINILSKAEVNNVRFIDPVLGRRVRDAAWLRHYKKNCKWYKRPLQFVWAITSNYGRNIWLWIMWSVIIAFRFGIQFYSMGPEAFEVTHLGHSFETMLYYSVVTFTTLGFGDVVPKTAEASYWVMAEVILGYIMLGGLISILANKLARRND